MLKEMLENKMAQSPVGEEPKEESGLPKIHLDETHLPEVKDWKDGETYHVVMKIKQVSPGEFDVEAASPIGDKEAEEDMQEESDEGEGEEEGEQE